MTLEIPPQYIPDEKLLEDLFLLTIEGELREAWRQWHDEMFYKNLKLCVDGAGLPEYLNLNPRK